MNASLDGWLTVITFSEEVYGSYMRSEHEAGIINPVEVFKHILY